MEIWNRMVSNVHATLQQPQPHPNWISFATSLILSALYSMEKMQRIVFFDDVDFSYNKCASWNGMRARLLNKNFEHVYTARTHRQTTLIRATGVAEQDSRHQSSWQIIISRSISNKNQISRLI